MNKVLLVIGDAAEVFDTLYPLHRIREDGFQVLVAAPEKRIYHLVMHDTHPDWDITVESPGYKLAAEIAFRDIRPEEYAGIVLSGGRAPEYLRLNPRVLALVRAFAKADKPIAAICHGAQLLAAAGVLEGRECSAYPACAPEVRQAGGSYVDIAGDGVHVEGKLGAAAAGPASRPPASGARARRRPETAASCCATVTRATRVRLWIGC